MALFTPKAQPAVQPNQLPPGALFRVPGLTARPRRVIEPGPAPQGEITTLQQGAAVNAAYSKFQTLDIDRAFLLELDFNTKFTQGASPNLLTTAPYSIAQWVNLLQVQFESAYSTFRLPGFLAQIMQQYRSVFAPKNLVASDFQSGADPNPTSALTSTWYPALSPLSTPNFALNVAGVNQAYSLYFEVPVSMYFDLYYELAATGQPVGPPIPRCIVSPQRMAATTRNVTPRLTFSPGISPQPANPQLSGPASKIAADATSTFTGTAASTWWRDAWIPSKNPLTEPPGRMWQYSRDFLTYGANGAQIAIPIDDEVPGQGQIMSLVFMTWDPALNGGIGGVTPYSAYGLVELLYGSSVEIFQDTPQSNLYSWGIQHGSILPNGVMGWDLALTEDGRLTNEYAINTLVTAGTQLRITFAAGQVPSAGSTTFVGLEVLKKVGS
ncbi:MAG: hypothetical protein ACREHG_03765 [Candidatus Saccharimonadales bacterium]